MTVDFIGYKRVTLLVAAYEDSHLHFGSISRVLDLFPIKSSRYEAYGIELEALLQGVILLETQWHRSWLPQRFPLVYVEYLASAPWNRRLIENPPYLAGVGRALLLFARQRSLKLGYGGRVGLHSLLGAEAFYRRYNMPDYGPDLDKEGLIYFEYTAFTL